MVATQQAVNTTLTFLPSKIDMANMLANNYPFNRNRTTLAFICNSASGHLTNLSPIFTLPLIPEGKHLAF